MASTSNQKKTDEKSQKENTAETNSDKTLGESADRLNSLLSKGFDLMETGLDLGFNLATKMGSVAQHKVTDIIHTAAEHYTAPKPESQNSADDKQAPQQENKDENLITPVHNRVALHPGSIAKLSFSIENDMAEKPKEVKLSLGEVFGGEKSGFIIDGALFTIKPKSITIDPMDFEKCVISGTIPKETPIDRYLGSVTVSDAEEYQIPVCLIITPKPIG